MTRMAPSVTRMAPAVTRKAPAVSSPDSDASHGGPACVTRRHKNPPLPWPGGRKIRHCRDRAAQKIRHCPGGGPRGRHQRVKRDVSHGKGFTFAALVS